MWKTSCLHHSFHLLFGVVIQYHTSALMSFMGFYIIVIRKTVFYFNGQAQIWNGWIKWLHWVTCSAVFSKMACSWDATSAIYLLHILLHRLWNWVDFFSRLVFKKCRRTVKVKGEKYIINRSNFTVWSYFLLSTCVSIPALSIEITSENYL